MCQPASTSDSATGARAARLIVDPPQSGRWNMAVDQALLEAVAASGGIVLRFYQWAEPTLSLGYFQTLASRVEHPASRDAALVRRASGGGAILHDRELTYSLALPSNDRAAKGDDLGAAGVLYRTVHESLIRVLSELGIATRLCEQSSSASARDQPFLCFARRAQGDVLLGDFKIAGSAQRRYRGAILQHGSILISTSPAAPELPGIAELASPVLTPERLCERWLPQLTIALGIACSRGPLDSAEEIRAHELVENRYGSREWTALK